MRYNPGGQPLTNLPEHPSKPLVTMVIARLPDVPCPFKCTGTPEHLQTNTKEQAEFGCLAQRLEWVCLSWPGGGRLKGTQRETTFFGGPYSKAHTQMVLKQRDDRSHRQEVSWIPKGIFLTFPSVVPFNGKHEALCRGRRGQQALGFVSPALATREVFPEDELLQAGVDIHKGVQV